MTFKGPVQGGPIKSREELEIEVNDAEEAARLLGGLGFVVILDYEKRRESWRMGDCQVELDEPPHVGLFVEIEGPRDGIRQTQERLGLGDVPHTPESYVQMLLSFSERNGLRGRPLRLT
jgi:adenylate cyclase class 2